MDAQRREIRVWAQASGHRVVTWCSDEGISGANGIESREGLFDALRALQAHSAEGLVVTSLDRLSRRMTEQEGILAQVWGGKCRIFSIGDGGELLEDDPHDPMRTAVRQMRGVFAQLERGLIRQRMAKGKAEKAARGGYVGGAPPLGYSALDRALVPDRREQEVVARIQALHESGLSLREIITVLKSEGHRPKRGEWHPSSVARVINRATGA